MKFPLIKALETAQMIVPEIDLQAKLEDGQVKLDPVPIGQWHYYMNAINSACALMEDELDNLPDIESMNELRAINEDVLSLILSLKVFYLCTLDHMETHQREEESKKWGWSKKNRKKKREWSEEQNKMERYSKYRKIIEERMRPPEEE